MIAIIIVNVNQVDITKIGNRFFLNVFMISSFFEVNIRKKSLRSKLS
jgi:hypothetical protein